MIKKTMKTCQTQIKKSTTSLTNIILIILNTKLFFMIKAANEKSILNNDIF